MSNFTISQFGIIIFSSISQRFVCPFNLYRLAHNKHTFDCPSLYLQFISRISVHLPVSSGKYKFMQISQEYSVVFFKLKRRQLYNIYSFSISLSFTDMHLPSVVDIPYLLSPGSKQYVQASKIPLVVQNLEEISTYPRSFTKVVKNPSKHQFRMPSVSLQLFTPKHLPFSR